MTFFQRLLCTNAPAALLGSIFLLVVGAGSLSLDAKEAESKIQ